MPQNIRNQRHIFYGTDVRIRDLNLNWLDLITFIMITSLFHQLMVV